MSPSTSTEATAQPALTLASRVRGPVLVAAAAAAAGVALVLRDPHTSGSWGYCPFLLLTGHPCPACGGLRATSDLLHGDLAAALGSNAYVVATLVGAVLLWAIWLGRRAAGRVTTWAPVHSRLAAWWLVGLLAFGVLRFVPALSGLQP